MGSVIDLAESAGVDVAVRLGRGERAVSEELLDHAQVGAALEEMGRERMPESVRVGEEAPNRARVQASAARRKEESVLGAACELGSRLLQVAAKPVSSFFPEWHDALLAALAPDVNGLLLEVDVAQVEVDGLLAAQAG